MMSAYLCAICEVLMCTILLTTLPLGPFKHCRTSENNELLTTAQEMIKTRCEPLTTAQVMKKMNEVYKVQPELEILVKNNLFRKKHSH